MSSEDLSREELLARVRELEQRMENVARTEAALEQERWQLQQYLEVAHGIIVLIGRDERVALINREGCRILGRELHEVLGRNWFDHFIPPRLREKVRSIFHRLLAGEVEPLAEYENPVLHRSGSERTILWHNALWRDRDGKIIGTLSSGIDVTHKRLVQQALIESEQLYRALFSVAPLGIGISTLDGRPIECNDRQAELFGYSRSEILKVPVDQF
jgi:PAS domain S-box-containing protein